MYYFDLVWFFASVFINVMAIFFFFTLFCLVFVSRLQSSHKMCHCHPPSNLADERPVFYQSLFKISSPEVVRIFSYLLMCQNFSIVCLDIKTLLLLVVVFCVTFGVLKEILLGPWLLAQEHASSLLLGMLHGVFDYCLPVPSFWDSNQTKSWNIWILTIMQDAPLPVVIDI